MQKQRLPGIRADIDPGSEPINLHGRRRPVSARLSHLATVEGGTMAFLDAAGTCLILVKRDPPINPHPQDHGGVHHAFAIAHDDYQAALDHLRQNGVAITFEEDRQGGVVNGPRAYFHDPDGTVLEFIDLTSYAGAS